MGCNTDSKEFCVVSVLQYSLLDEFQALLHTKKVCKYFKFLKIFEILEVLLIFFLQIFVDPGGGWRFGGWSSAQEALTTRTSGILAGNRDTDS
jgi:hypothetical protein